MRRLSSIPWIVVVACTPSRADTEAPAIAWSPPVEIAAGGGQRGPWQQNESAYDYVDDPGVALGRDGAAAVVWVDQRRKDVWFRTYERDGQPRRAAVNVSRTPAVFSWLPRVALSPTHPDDVYVLWQEIIFSGGSHGGDILFARSRDGGASFGAPMNLSRSQAGDGKARLDRKTWLNGSLDLVVGDDGTLYVAWTEYEGRLWFRRSTDRGERFGEQLLVEAGTARPARAPSLAVNERTVHLAWTVGEDASADVRLATSPDGGRTFGKPRIVELTRGYSDAPKLAVDRDGTLHLAHAETGGGPFARAHVRYLRSRDGGKTFEPARAISQPLPRGVVSAGFPSLGVDERGDVYVLWELFPALRQMPRGLGITFSRDGGQTFTPPELVPGSRDPGGGANGSHQGPLMRKLAVRAGQLAVVNSALAHGKGSRVWLLRGTQRGQPVATRGQ